MSAMENVLTTLRVLEAVADHQPVGVSELSRVTQVPKTTVQRSLETLRVAGWLERGEGGVWVLSLRCAVIGRRAGQRGAVRELARPAMLRLHQATDESVRLWMQHGHSIVLVESIESLQPVRTVTPATFSGTLPIHAEAPGKAILALLPPAEQAELLREPLVALTPWTVTDPAELEAELARVRADGYAVARQEAVREVATVAAPITAEGRPVAALAVSLPLHRCTDDVVEQLARLVVEAAAGVSV